VEYLIIYESYRQVVVVAAYRGEKRLDEAENAAGMRNAASDYIARV